MVVLYLDLSLIGENVRLKSHTDFANRKKAIAHTTRKDKREVAGREEDDGTFVLFLLYTCLTINT